MKKMVSMLFVVLAIVVGAFSYAQAETVTLSGEKGQVDLFAAELRSKGITDIKSSYGQPAMGTYKGKPWPGVRYQIGSDRTEDGWVPVSDARVDQGELCDIQKEQAEGIVRVLSRRSQPRETKVLYCPSGKCWPPNPQGKYTTLVPHEGIRTVLNIDPEKWNEVLSIKMEGYKNNIPRDGWLYGSAPVWGPTFVYRNVHDLKVARQLMADPRVMPYVQCIRKLKKSAPQYDGEVCDEVTIGLGGTTVKNDSPPECPFPNE